MQWVRRFSRPSEGILLTRLGLGVLLLGLVLAFGLVFVSMSGAPVTILTGTGGISGNTVGSTQVGCYTDYITAELVTDPTFGTAVIEHNSTGRNPDHRYPVMWLPGDTGRSSGSEVEILDRSGSVIARTGQAWQIEGGFQTGPGGQVDWVACGYVLPPSARQ